MVRAEQTIQNELIRWVHETYPQLIVTATANEHQRKQRIGSIGIPDLIIFHAPDAVLFLELKTITGKLSEAQKEWKAAYDEAGFTHSYAVAYGFNNAKMEIESWMKTLKKKL